MHNSINGVIPPHFPPEPDALVSPDFGRTLIVGLREHSVEE
ncbi:MAG: hypothetical protein AAFX93_20555 [Verrucomicrobiota bacterium]